MIELRWLETKGFGGSPVKILQYRQTVDTTVRAGMWNSADTQKTANYQMSAWQDVPVVHDNVVPLPIGDQVKQQYTRCSKCNVELNHGPMSYVCPHMNCPTGLGSSS